MPKFKFIYSDKRRDAIITNMDYSNWYSNISKAFRSETASRVIKTLDVFPVFLLACTYILSLIILFIKHSNLLLQAFFVPVSCFIFVTLLRILLNRPRPYEAKDIRPLIQKQTQGKSFPSRHIASSCIIAMELLFINNFAGIVAWILCAILCFTRIIGGVHYPSDVFAALAISILFGVLGFYVI